MLTNSRHSLVKSAVVIPPQMKWLASMDRVLSLLGERANPVVDVGSMC
jgi:hypothetical protein